MHVSEFASKLEPKIAVRNRILTEATDAVVWLLLEASKAVNVRMAIRSSPAGAFVFTSSATPPET